jgi:multidrug resistance efflux pump
MSQPTFDPIAAWQKFVSDWERQVNEASANVTSTPEFSRAMNEVTKMSLAAQRQFAKQMEQVLKTMNLPSRTDVTAINERLGAIEEILERLTSQAGMSEPPAAQSTIARTRKPPPET